MSSWSRVARAAFLTLTLARAASAEQVTYAQAMAMARQHAPDLLVSRGREAVASAETRVAGIYPNPSFVGGTSTQAAKLSVTASIPLLVFGQRGAAVDASRAEYETVRVDSEVAWNEVRAQTARAFVALWQMERVATARAETAAISKRLEEAVTAKVEVGAAPEMDGLRVRAEHLRAEADAREAEQLVEAAGSELGRWLGVADGSTLRTSGDLPGGAELSPDGLRARVAESPSVRREEADARAAEARAQRERAFVRPQLVLDLGVDARDPTLPATNYRAALGIEVPLFNQRGPMIERETLSSALARTRSRAERVRLESRVTVALKTFTAVSGRKRALEDGVLPAAEAAANATQESYRLGRAPLFAVLDAERARIDAKLSLLDASAARANAWIDVEQAVGTP